MEIENSIYIEEDDIIMVSTQGKQRGDGSVLHLIIECENASSSIDWANISIWIPIDRARELLEKMKDTLGENAT